MFPAPKIGVNKEKLFVDKLVQVSLYILIAYLIIAEFGSSRRF